MADRRGELIKQTAGITLERYLCKNLRTCGVEGDEPSAGVGGHESRLAPCSGAIPEGMGKAEL